MATHSSDQRLSIDIAAMLRVITKAAERDSRSLFQAFGVNRTQLLVLREMECEGALALGEIAKRVQLAQPTVSDCVKQLARAGLIERVKSEIDRRQVLCSLTRAGAELIERSPRVIEERLVEKLDVLPDSERQSVVATLKRVAELIDGDASRKTPASSRAPEPHRGRAPIGRASVFR